MFSGIRRNRTGGCACLRKRICCVLSSSKLMSIDRISSTNNPRRRRRINVLSGRWTCLVQTAGGWRGEGGAMEEGRIKRKNKEKTRKINRSITRWNSGRGARQNRMAQNRWTAWWSRSAWQEMKRSCPSFLSRLQHPIRHLFLSDTPSPCPNCYFFYGTVCLKLDY